MNSSLSRIANVVGVLLIARALVPIFLFIGSGWELLFILLALPGVIAGGLMLVGVFRFGKAPGSAVICFVLAAIFSLIATETSVSIASGVGALLSLVVHWTLVLVTIMLAALSLRSLMRTQGGCRRTWGRGHSRAS